MSDIAILTYWDGRGNGESIRLMMAAAGQQWEERVYKNDADHLSTFDDLKVMFDDGVLAFDQVPLLQIDGLNLTQKYAIVRYLARKHNMYGSSNIEATQCDIIFDGIMDFKSKLVMKEVKASFETALQKYGPRFQRILSSNTAGKFFVGSGLTFVDVALFEFMLAGKEYDVDLSKYPLLEEWYAQVAAVPSLVDYVSNRRYPSPGLPGYYERVAATMPWLFGKGDAPEMTSTVWNVHKH